MFCVLYVNSEKQLEDMTEDEIEMMKVMGFAAFDTTKVSQHVKTQMGKFTLVFCVLYVKP